MLEWLYGFAAFLSGAGAPMGQEQVAEQYGVCGSRVGVAYHDPVLPAKPVGWPEVADEIASLQTARNLPPSSPERIFLVFSRGLFPGHAAAGWCALHGGDSVTRIAIIPYPDENGCGASTPAASWQSVTAHEIIEAATDPEGGRGWTSPGPQGEAGDLCAWQETQLSFGTVQLFADNIHQACSVWTLLEVAHLSAVSWASNRLDIVTTGLDSGVHHKWWDGAAWGPSITDWQDLGGQARMLLRRPKVVSWSQDRLDILARGLDGACYHKWWDGASWGPSVTDWQYLGGEFGGDVTAVSWAPDRLDIFCRGLDGHLYHKWWDGNSWGPGPLVTDWQSLGGIIAGNPACVSWAPGRLDAFARGLDGGIYHQWSSGGQNWSGFQPLGGQMAGSPTVVSWAPDRLDIFCRGLDGSVNHKWWDGAAWGPSVTDWQSLGGVIQGDPTAVSWAADRLDIFARGLDGACYHKWWDGTSWGPSITDWQNLGGQVG
jgi:hypothetical protein